MKIEIKNFFQKLLALKSKKSSYTLYALNPVLIIVIGILVVSAVVGLSSGPRPTPTPTPTPVVSPSPETTTQATLESTVAPSPTAQVKGEEVQLVLVTKVIDGDTIALENGEVVRYIGIDTPETVHPQKPIQCFGQEASNKNKELVEGKKVRLEKDISERDKYNRLLRYVWIGDVFVNEYLVRQGYAQSYTYPPDVKYQDLFLEAQKEARENNRGLWSACAYFGELKAQPTPKPTLISTPPPQTQGGGGSKGYTCNCSKTCDEISSCDEAYFQLNTCGCSKRDGDKDGVPCEKLCR